MLAAGWLGLTDYEPVPESKTTSNNADSCRKGAGGTDTNRTYGNVVMSTSRVSKMKTRKNGIA